MLMGLGVKSHLIVSSADAKTSLTSLEAWIVVSSTKPVLQRRRS